MSFAPGTPIRNHLIPENRDTVKLGDTGKEFQSVDVTTLRTADLAVSDDLTVTGDVTVTGSVVTGTPLGTAGTGVTQVESLDAVRQTVLTLTDVAVPIVVITTGNGIGGALLWTFPAYQALLHGTTASLTISVAAAEQSNFEATPEGDLGVGTVIITDPTAFSTDATDDDILAGRAFNMAAGFTDTEAFTSPAAQLLAASTEVNVNVFVDAADIDDGVTTEVLINGTIVLTWAPLGAV